MFCQQINHLICSPRCIINLTSVRCINVVNKKRLLAGKAPRRGESVLFDGPEFSFMDGRGPAPLTHGQRRRYEQNKYFAEQIVKYMKDFELAKQLRPDQPVERQSIRHQEKQPSL